MGEPRPDIGNALILVVGSLIVVPGTFSHYVLANALREQNLCHVGPISLQPNSLANKVMFQERRDALVSLYGTYTTFDDASYYFVKTPYDISPQVLPDYGYWSISTLSLTLLSPFLRRQRQLDWKSIENTYNVDTAPSIQWDQSHQIQYTPSNEHSSKSNRWCLQNRQNPKMYQRDGDSGVDGDGEHQDTVFRDAATASDVTTVPHATPDLFRICARPQTSILSSGDQSPYFVELPLHQPMTGIWKRYETDLAPDQVHDDDNEGSYAMYRRSKRPTNPNQLQVQCHVRDLELLHLAHGSLQPDSQPHLGWEHAERISMPIWNIFYLPGTCVILITLLLVQLRRRQSTTGTQRRHILGIREQQPREVEEDWNIVRAVQLLWFHDSWHQWLWTSAWVYLIGTLLEPLLGTVPYLGVSILFMQLVAVISHDSSFLWVCFGQSVLLAQLEPSLAIGPLEISALAVGISSNALKVNILNVLIALFPMLTSPTEIPWRTAASCLLVGWSVAKPLMLELLGAPQWTVPMVLLAHLWWKLTKEPDLDLKKTDVETSSLFDVTEEVDGEFDHDDERSQFSLSSTRADVSLTIHQRLIHFVNMVGFYVLVTTWFVLNVGCIFTMDWTLVVGNMMTLWLCIGSNKLPHLPLWSLYQMVASSIMIIISTMTLAGWYLCHVAIVTRVLNALPPSYVYASMGLQIVAHMIALLHTAKTKQWDTSRSVPGYYFWNHLRILAEEILVWYHVLC